VFGRSVLRQQRDRGFTLVELLIAMTIFAIVSVAFFQVLLSGNRASTTTTDVVKISEEARLAFNRMIRDTRQADSITSATSTSYRVFVDYNADGTYENPTTSGDYEDLTFELNGNQFELNNEVLATGISQIAGQPYFAYSSNHLEWDWNGDGITTLTELQDAPSHGVFTVADPMQYVTNVTYAFQVNSGGRNAQFYGEAQLRNER
jgi:prepilin-type N-terminal cleavage/methylation domain-containing protein